MAVTGLGVDIIEIERMKRALERSPRFKARVFSEDEQRYCDSKARPEVHYALRFAAKEAVLKALGTGFGQGVGARDVEVANDAHGRPVAVLHGRAAEIAKEQGVLELHLSLSRTHNVGVANAVAVTEEMRPAADTQQDMAAQMQAAFKQVKREMDAEDAAGALDADNAGTQEAAPDGAAQTGDAAPDGAAQAQEAAPDSTAQAQDAGLGASFEEAYDA